MRVLLVAKPWRGGLSHYMYHALTEVFPGAVEWLPTVPGNMSELLRYRRDRSAWRRCLVERINRMSYDLALFIGSFPELRELRVRPGNVLWMNDHPDRQVAYSDSFAAIYISDPGYCEAMRASRAGNRFAGVLPFACSPSIHYPTATTDRCGVCFIGNRDSNRDAPLSTLLESNRHVRIYGNYFLRHRLFWRHPLRFRPSVPIANMGAVYGRFQVSVNLHAKVIRGGTNMRTFECAGYGIPQVVEYRPGLEELFEPGREISVFRDTNEMVAQIGQLMCDREAAARMSERARARALAEHTYVHRVRSICRLLQLKVPA